MFITFLFCNFHTWRQFFKVIKKINLEKDKCNIYFISARLLHIFETIDTILIHLYGVQTWNFITIYRHSCESALLLILHYNSSKLCRCCFASTSDWRMTESAKIHWSCCIFISIFLFVFHPRKLSWDFSLYHNSCA